MSDLIETLFVPVTKLSQVSAVVGAAKWAELRSACELARSWMRARNFPPEVRDVLDSNPVWKSAQMIRGFFEHGDLLDGPSGPSRTDLMVIAKTGAGLATLAVEGKVDEPFDNKTVRQWSKDTSGGKIKRLEVVCRVLAVEPDRILDTRYQLLHRAAAAVREARRFGAQDALVLVHAFTRDNVKCDASKADGCAADYAQFAKAIELAGGARNTVVGPRICGEVRLWLAWVDSAPLPYDGSGSRARSA